MIKKLMIAGALSSGLVVSAAGAAFASTAQHVSAARPAAAQQAKATEVRGGESTGENSGEQEGSMPGDGPGGHADPAGQNVDHQFTGVE
jgi:hypothetical protein